MFQELSESLHAFTPHEQERYELLASLSEREREKAFQSDKRFVWKDETKIGSRLDSYERYGPKQELAVSRNMRFVRCLPHSHTYIEIQYVYSGRIENVIDNQKVTVAQGEILLMDSNIEHEVLPAGENDIGINLIMNREFFDSKFRGILLQNNRLSRLIVESLYEKKEDKKYILFSCSEDERIQWAVKMLLLEWKERDNGYHTAMQGYLEVVFTYLVRNYYKENLIADDSTEHALMEELISYLSSHYATADLRSTAEYFGFNQDYLSRMIKKQIGVSFVTLMQDIRMEQACIMLANTDMPVDEISHLLGYHDASYFYKVFRKKYSQTPKEYRIRQS